jgi:hypothetical protein
LARPKARKAFFPISPSDWVYCIFLTCDNQLGVWFRHGQKIISRPKKGEETAPGQWIGVGGVPAFCCLYPRTQGERAENLYDLATVWSYGGEFVHRFLYKIEPYTPCQPPDLSAIGQCTTSCRCSATNVGNVFTITVVVTNSDGSATKGEQPQGSVLIEVDGVQICDVALPAEDEPDDTNQSTVTCTYTCTDSDAHTVTATYTPAAGQGLLATECGTTIQCPSQGITTACCPSNPIPTRLFFTWTCSAITQPGIPVSIELDYDSSSQSWISTCIPDSTSVGEYWLFTLDCTSGGLGTAWQFSAGGLGVTAGSVTCSPISLSFVNVGGQTTTSSTCTGNQVPAQTFNTITVTS